MTPSYEQAATGTQKTGHDLGPVGDVGEPADVAIGRRAICILRIRWCSSKAVDENRFRLTIGGIMSDKRSAFQQKVVDALLDSKAIDIAAIGATMSSFGDHAARHGESMALVLNRNFIINCGWPGPFFDQIGGHGDGPQVH